MESEDLVRLYENVLKRERSIFRVNENNIRTAIQDMKDVYMPEGEWHSSTDLTIANYDNAAHRCAYIHKYASCHTGLLIEMLQRAIADDPSVFLDLFDGTSFLNLCCIGGGPGTDIIGFLTVFSWYFGKFKCEATVLDYSLGWKKTFNCIVKELRNGKSYGDLSYSVLPGRFHYDYIGTDLLSSMTPDVNKAIGSADFLTMIKFISAAARHDTNVMVKKIFNSMKPGAVLLFIDNAGGGFHQLVMDVAQGCNLETVFGPFRHELYQNDVFRVKRFGYMSQSETKVTVHMWRKLRSGKITLRSNVRKGMASNRPAQPDRLLWGDILNTEAGIYFADRQEYTEARNSYRYVMDDSENLVEDDSDENTDCCVIA
ncbi:uncharacterized protein LOC118184807 [Stegodyphus dumicola]|uniref:uncharacterized protein LOC118184807 n=1 Tax=Stegodyphus dumicola TaxID=202533 RepID=UPI0015B29F93|nr:uncharacterized protein LOC118184807 [Stegodyphus dumicola]